MASGNSGLMVFLLTSLIVASSLTSYFVMANYGYSITQINTPNMGINTYTNNKDFISNCTLTDYDLTGSWTCGSNGLSLIGGGSLKQYLTDTERQNGIYRNTYRLYPQGGNYYILLFENWIGNNIRLEIRNDGFHIRYLTLFNWFYAPDASFIPYDNALSLTDITITTITDTVTPAITLEINNKQYVINMENLPKFSNGDLKYPVGVGADDKLIVSSISKNFVSNPNASTSLFDGLNMIMAFIANMLTILLWNLDPSIFPWELNIIFIKPQTLGIFISLIFLVRG